MLLLCSAALAGDVLVDFTTQVASSAVTFHDVEDGDTLWLVLPDARDRPAVWFEATVSVEGDGLTFDMMVYDLKSRRWGFVMDWLSSPRVSSLDNVQGRITMREHDEVWLDVGVIADFSGQGLPEPDEAWGDMLLSVVTPGGAEGDWTLHDPGHIWLGVPDRDLPGLVEIEPREDGGWSVWFQKQAPRGRRGNRVTGQGGVAAFGSVSTESSFGVEGQPIELPFSIEMRLAPLLVVD